MPNIGVSLDIFRMDGLFPCSDTIAKCFAVMKLEGFFPTLFVTRDGEPPSGVFRAYHTPVNGPEMATLASFVEVGGDSEAAKMKVWKWEQESPEVARESPRFVWFIFLISTILGDISFCFCFFIGPRCTWGPIYGSRCLSLTE